jgi:hypothetical protein
MKSPRRRAACGVLACALLVAACSGSGTSNTAIPSTSSPARGAVSGRLGDTVCDWGPNKFNACVYYQNSVMKFTHPGPGVDGTFDLVSTDQYEPHGEIRDNNGPESPVKATNPRGWAGYESNGEGIEAYDHYTTSGAPYRPQDKTGWHIDMPSTAGTTNGGNCEPVTEFVFCDMNLPGLKDWNAEYRLRMYNRPLAITIHNAVKDLTVQKMQAETAGGLLLDPAATNQPANATIQGDDGTRAHSGNGYYGGYRSTWNDANFGVVYEVTDPGSVYRGIRFLIHVTVKKDDPNASAATSTCTVANPTTAVSLSCSVVTHGSNTGETDTDVNIATGIGSAAPATAAQ